jgi:DNA-binding MarR family transcriptional regulator
VEKARCLCNYIPVNVSIAVSPAGLSSAELRAWRGLLRTHARLVKALDAELERAHGIGLTTYEVLVYLDTSPECRMRMSDLADSILLSRSGLTRLADRLARDGLIARATCPTDARGAYAVLTALGREKLGAARETHHAGVRTHFLAHLTGDEREALAALWDRLAPETARRGC